MKTKLLKKFRAKYSIKKVDVVRCVEIESAVNFLREEFYLVENSTGYVFPKQCKSILEALIISIDEFLPYTQQGMYKNSILKAEMRKEQILLKKMILIGKR